MSTDLQHKTSEKVLHVRVSSAMHEIAQQLAKDRACSLSDLMRHLLVVEAETRGLIEPAKTRRKK